MKKAFTILEILVVVAVLAILIGIAIPRFKGMKDAGNLAKVQSELTSIRAALESYRTFDSSKLYPPSSTYATNLTAGLLSQQNPKIVGVMYDPFGATSNTEYNYASSSNQLYYLIWSVGITGSTVPRGINNAGEVTFN